MDVERCVGCDQAARLEAGGHPTVVVMATEDAAARGVDVSQASARGFVHAPVCRACHVDPAHRVFAIKGHFFEKAQARQAVARAGANAIG